MIALALSLLSLVPQGPDHVLKVNGPSPGTVRLGESSVVELIIEGSRSGLGEPQIPEVEGLQFQLRGGGSSSSFVWVPGGRIQMSRQLKYLLQIHPLRVGRFTIPPIRISSGSKWLETPELRLDVFEELTGQEMGFLDVVPSATRVYVHEPIRFIVDFGVDAGLELAQGRYEGVDYLDVQIQASWLSNLEAGEPLEVADPQNPVPLVLNRGLQRAQYEAGHERDGRRYHRFVFEKAFLPNKLGRFELDAPILVCSIEQSRIGRFGQRLRGSARTEPLVVYGEPLTIEVLPIPEKGRPLPFYGAVGRFEVTTSLDRTQAKVGSSVKVNLTITGTGNFEFLRVPELDKLDGFHLLGKTLNRDANQVEVTYDLTPLDASVTAVPTINWNFFDTTPGVERFVEVATDPLPLSVLPLDAAESLALLAGAEDNGVVPGVDDIFNIKVVDVPSLGNIPVVHPRRPSLVAVAVFGPWLLMGLLGLALQFFRRRAADVVGQRARSAARQFERDLTAGKAPGEALVAYLAARFGIPEAAVIGPDLAARLEEAAVPPPLAAEAARGVEGGIAARYGGSSVLDEGALRDLVRRFEAEAKNLKLLAQVGVLLLGVLLAVPALGAQDPSGDYLAGHYVEAEAGYAERVKAGNADRRWYYNLGNARYRQGKLPEALWAYENAHLAMPRDRELLANIALVKMRLDLTSIEGEPFLDALVGLRNSVTPRERLFLCGLFNLVAAGFLFLAWRRRGLRVAGFVLLVPALFLAADVLWVEPNEAPLGIVLQDRLALVSEPRRGLEPVLTLRGGVSVNVLAEGPAWTQVEVRGRTGYLPAETVGVVR